MCGLVGAIALGKLTKKDELIRQKVMRYVTTELLLRTEDRGKDATGAAILFNNGNYAGIKRGEEASKWFGKFGSGTDKYGSLLKIWKECEDPVKIYIGHCRKGTIGDKEDNVNNHPIKVKNIVGVHNGVIRNDAEIQKHLDCKRDGIVDSEMIFRLYHHMTNEGKEPFTMDMMETLIARLTGAFTVMAFNADNIHQFPVFRDGRDLELVFVKDLSILFMVSELKFWNSFHFQYERSIFYHELKMPSFLNMDVEKKRFPDDHAAIFNLDVTCTKETTIDDLGEFKKIPRDNKVWTSIAALNKSNTATGAHTYRGGQSMDKTFKKEKKKENTVIINESNTVNITSKDNPYTQNDTNDTGDKKRVFNSLTKKYEIKCINNPKTLKADESKILSTEITETKEKSKVTFEDDDNKQEVTAKVLMITDYSFYKKEYDVVKDTDTTGTGSEDTIESNADDIAIEAEYSEVELELTTTESTELIVKADKSYEHQDSKEKGYSNVDTLLDDISIKNEKIATDLGIVILSNRVAKIQWVKGFMVGWCNRNKELKNGEEKTRQREKYIDGLKSLVIILAQTFKRVKESVKTTEVKSPSIVLQEAAVSHLSNRKQLDMKKLETVFNDYEIDKIKDVGVIISTIANSKN